AMKVVERNYPDLYKRFISMGPLMEKLGNACKGHNACKGQGIKMMSKAQCLAKGGKTSRS
ncbi:MAG: hypothetical protein ABL894_14010, partial [Hyphomicrobium sp.]